jgi:hypothetical protein
MNLYVLTGGFAVLVLCAAIAGLWARIGMIEREIKREADARKEFWNEWHTEKWDVRSALATIGLEKTPAVGATWKLPSGKPK